MFFELPLSAQGQVLQKELKTDSYLRIEDLVVDTKPR